MGIRPEDIKASQLELQTYADTILSPEVLVSELLGSESMLYTKLDGVEFVSRVEARDSHTPGTKVELAFNLSQAHFFDKETGKNIFIDK